MIDLDTALERCGGDRDLLRELGEIFIKTLAAMQSELSGAWERGETSEVRRHVHTLKNSADNIGAPAIRENARALEEAIATYGIAPGMAVQRDELLAQLNLLAEEVRDRIVAQQVDGP